MQKQTNLTNSQPNLYRVFNGDGNDRQETYRFKAYDINDVVEYIKKQFFNFDKDFTIDDLDIDWQGEDIVYISWDSGCIDCEEKDSESCDFCEISSSYFEVFKEENTEPNEFSFNTIEGTNNYVDLTLPTPKHAEDWNPELSLAWKVNPQLGCDCLQQLTLDNKLPQY